MCTVTFIAQKGGYCLGMNRDEKLTRPVGLAPQLKKVNGRAVVSPSEPGGGTWIALTDGGTCLALINWHSVAGRVARKAISRGEVVNVVATTDSAVLTEAALHELPLCQINPFRLVGVFPATAEIVEWRWNLKKLVSKTHPWRAQQWISSGFDEPDAQRIRARTFRQARRQKSVGSLDWLRRLHRSHAPQCGPFSTCMHRVDAATVSYTEVSVSPRRAVMRYCSGTSCSCSSKSLLCIQLRSSQCSWLDRPARAALERTSARTHRR